MEELQPWIQKRVPSCSLLMCKEHGQLRSPYAKRSITAAAVRRAFLTLCPRVKSFFDVNRFYPKIPLS